MTSDSLNLPSQDCLLNRCIQQFSSFQSNLLSLKRLKCCVCVLPRSFLLPLHPAQLLFWSFSWCSSYHSRFKLFLRHVSFSLALQASALIAVCLQKFVNLFLWQKSPKLFIFVQLSWYLVAWTYPFWWTYGRPGLEQQVQ